MPFRNHLTAFKITNLLCNKILICKSSLCEITKLCKCLMFIGWTGG